MSRSGPPQTQDRAQSSMTDSTVGALDLASACHLAAAKPPPKGVHPEARVARQAASRAALRVTPEPRRPDPCQQSR